jgi:hypothetical protein
MVNDTTIGYLLIGVGIVFVLALVFAISARSGAPAERPRPPRGVHLPGPSWLPVMMAVGGALLGAGLAFRPDEEGTIANLWLAVPGLIVVVVAVVAWVRAAGREWRDTEHGPAHDDSAGH